MIKIENVVKNYKTKSVTVEALKNVSLEINSGMIFITGRSGSGKTTLLNLIGALDKYDSGSIKVDNKELKEMSSRELDDYRANEIGIIFQEYNLLENFSVKENINMPLLIQGIENENPIDEALRNVELEEMKNRKTNELSGGQRQRVAIARTIVKKPRIILADEPTGAVDSETAEIIFNCLKKLSETSLVIIASHDLESANKYADRIISFKDGRIVEDRVINDKNQSIVKKEEETAKLKNKEILKLALSFLFRKPKRLIMILLIFILSLTGIIISDTFGSSNTDKVLLNEMKKNDTRYLVYSQSFYTSDSNIESYMDDEDVNYLLQKIKYDGKIDYVYSFYDEVDYNYGALASSNNYYRIKEKGHIEIDNDFMSMYNFKLSAGRLPENDNEVVVTEYIYNKFQYYGYKEGNKSVKISTFDDLIDKDLYLTGRNDGFKIVGILDTLFNEKRYSKIRDKNFVDNGLKSQFLINSYESEMNSGIHNSLYFMNGYTKRFFGDYTNEAAYVRIIVPFSTSESNKLKLFVNEVKYPTIKDKYEKNNIVSVEYSIEKGLFTDVELLKNYFNLIIEITQIVSVVLIALITLLFIYYFNGLVDGRKKEIGILTAIGIKKAEVRKIFLIEALYIALLNIIMTLIVSLMILRIMNSFTTSTLGLSVEVFYISIRQIVFLVGFSILVIILGSYLPLKKISKKQLINLIRGK
ncbi:ABC transporter ATP-binding protein/permease [Haploplasma axanthum]|uniref:ABC transporter ATP-binding protein n=2 Tax=Haploplasma axanthum TaxID=29552 RepID=A0A449BD06_HAPAX|nr:ATP-binding cassette domain-containing protein [Haploplasma axanthum]VEU80200.1 ABC transporter ATP-binding protein [Haploplasma axanthum]